MNNSKGWHKINLPKLLSNSALIRNYCPLASKSNQKVAKGNERQVNFPFNPSSGKVSQFLPSTKTRYSIRNQQDLGSAQEPTSYNQ